MEYTAELDPVDLANAWPILSEEERLEGFRLLPRVEAEDFFVGLSARDQAALVRALPNGERRSWLRLLEPDDAADLLQECDPEERAWLVGLLDEPSRREVTALLAYAEDEAGGLMSPRYARLRPEMTADEAILYLRRQAFRRRETIYYTYVLDAAQHLLGVVSFRELISAPPQQRVAEIMHTDVVTVTEETDQEQVARLFAEYDLLAIPVVDDEGHIVGVVTVDDIVDVFQEEATEDIQKIGGMEALDAPYLDVGFGEMIRKRGGWLAVLFLGEMLTATAMGFFEHEIAAAVVLALFIPLIISSGGNSGSQATTLVIRAMALGEVKMRDWWRVVGREAGMGLALGALLGAIGFTRIVLWHAIGGMYGEHYLLIGFTIAFSLVGVVLFGTLAGSMLPFVLRRFGLDPASASAPFVATLVDVTGLVIYFTVASLVLRGTLL
ncbi:MAG TPA: magnesium transporter [Longimicrobiaceae bacterium]|nr:magnesium transporter [Longimicrobiaceae bacterium]